jgi:hypothetical protein
MVTNLNGKLLTALTVMTYLDLTIIITIFINFRMNYMFLDFSIEKVKSLPLLGTKLKCFIMCNVFSTSENVIFHPTSGV